MLPRLMFGGGGDSGYHVIVAWVAIILMAPTLVLLWRCSTWTKREKMKVVALGSAFISLISIGLSLIRFGDFNFLFEVVVGAITFAINTGFLAFAIYPLWAVANFFKGRHVSNDSSLNANRTFGASKSSVPVMPGPVGVPVASERER